MCYPCPRTDLLPFSPDRTPRPANIQMEPTYPTVCATMALRRAAHLKRWAAMMTIGQIQFCEVRHDA